MTITIDLNKYKSDQNLSEKINVRTYPRPLNFSYLSLFRSLRYNPVFDSTIAKKHEKVPMNTGKFSCFGFAAILRKLLRSRLSNTFKSAKHKNISSEAIRQYLTYFEEAYLIKEAKRYDVKGRKYIDTPLKYYFTDMGLRNSWLNYSQLEENHIMENIIYSELLMRGYSVDVGVVEYQYCDSEKKKTKVQLEVDFIARTAGDTIYIQSALHIDSDEKREQEIHSLKRINDSFQKIVIVRDHIMPYKDANGIRYIGIIDFLLQDTV